MTIAKRMRAKLTEAFSPERLDIIDDSENHRGHGGYRDGGETHFNLVIVAAAFDGMPRIQRQRAIFRVLEAEMTERVHALSIKARGLSEKNT